MKINRDYLIEKRDGYREAYMQALAQANANHGAMQALDELIAQYDAPEQNTGEVAGNLASPDEAVQCAIE